MLSKLLLASLSFLVIFGAIHSDGDKSCIDVTPMANFDPAKFYGHFYLTASSNETHSKFDCFQYLFFVPKEDGTLPLVKVNRKRSKNSKHMIFKNLRIDPTGQGSTEQGYVTVVGTDYSNYVITFSCHKSTNMGDVTVWMGTAHPGPMDFFQPQSVLDPYNINIHSLIFMNQQVGCPTDWSDAKMEELDFTYDEVKEELIAYNITRAKEYVGNWKYESDSEK